MAAAGTLTDTAVAAWITCKPALLRNCVTTARSTATIDVAAASGPATAIYTNYAAQSSLCAGSSTPCIASSAEFAVLGSKINSVANACLPTPIGPPTAANTWAVSFAPSANYVLSSIQVPIAYSSGVNQFYAWITADNNGTPGTALEVFVLPPLPSSPPIGTLPAVVLFNSVLRPPINSGATYWLTIGPGAASSCGGWYAALNDTATDTDLLMSQSNTIGSLHTASSWSGGYGGTYATLRPAFEIDGIKQ